MIEPLKVKVQDLVEKEKPKETWFRKFILKIKEMVKNDKSLSAM